MDVHVLAHRDPDCRGMKVRWPNSHLTLINGPQDERIGQLLDTVGDVTDCYFEENKNENEPRGTFIQSATFKPKISPIITRQEEIEAEIEPPSACEEVCSDLLELLQTGLMSDVTLSCQTKTWKCHRVILAARCEYFRAMFESGMKETSSDVIELHGADDHIVFLILEYLYSGRINLEEIVKINTDLNDSVNIDNTKHKTSKCDENDHVEMLKCLSLLIQATDYFSLPKMKTMLLQEVYNIASETNNCDELEKMWILAGDVQSRPLQKLIVMRVNKLLDMASISESDFYKFSKQMQKDVLDIRPETMCKPLWRTLLCGAIDLLNELAKADRSAESLNKIIEDNSPYLLPYHVLCDYQLSPYKFQQASEELSNFNAVGAISLLFNLGILPNAMDENGNNALHVAASYGEFHLLEALIKNGGCVSTLNDQGQNVMDILSSLNPRNSSINDIYLCTALYRCEKLLEEERQICVPKMPPNLLNSAVVAKDSQRTGCFRNMSINPEFIDFVKEIYNGPKPYRYLDMFDIESLTEGFEEPCSIEHLTFLFPNCIESIMQKTTPEDQKVALREDFQNNLRGKGRGRRVVCSRFWSL